MRFDFAYRRLWTPAYQELGYKTKMYIKTNMRLKIYAS
jgi:hypothetical protein